MDYLKKITTARPVSHSVHSPLSLLEETESNRGRIIQSAALRRLQQKTQVYPLETNAAVRSRLTHSLEVQQTGRLLAQTILSRLQKRDQSGAFHLTGIETPFINLVEMACLLHDVGNPPFGHFGEASISRWFCDHAADCYQQALKNRPGHSSLFTHTLLPDLCTFEGNAQGLRIVHNLHHLNLTHSQIAALIKYTRPPYKKAPGDDDPFYYRQKKPGFYYSEQALVTSVWDSLAVDEGCRFPLVYIMEAADDIAYCIADLEDAVDKGILSLEVLKNQLILVWQELNAKEDDYLIRIINHANTAGDGDFITHLRTRLVKELVNYAADRYLNQHQAVFNGTLDEPLINGGSSQHLALETLKTVAIRHVFNKREKETPELRGHAALVGLLTIYRTLLILPRADFEAIAYQDADACFIEQRLFHRLPKKYKAAYSSTMAGLSESSHTDSEKNDLEWYYRVRLIIDYISGMTDHFVVSEYQQLSAI